jgi:long-subunit acyl-CoA synthetase (AMP-forming)
MYSGRHIFAGYMGMEDKTQETIDADGFMHSGDVVKVSLPNVRNLNLNRSGLFSL